MSEQTASSVKRPAFSGRPLALLTLFTAAAFVIAYLLTRHSNHLWQLLPYGLLIACPLLHIVHHSRHRTT